MEELENLFKRLNIKPKNIELYKRAFRHSSYSNEHKGLESYERLEFLGDAVLELVTSEYFYLNSTLAEGAMSKKRASFVCEEALATYSKKIGLNKYIRVGNGELNNINDTIIADVFEAVLAVIYLECGFNKAKEYIDKIIIPYINADVHFLEDYKSLLQELVQTDKESLVYDVVDEMGPAHDKTFVVEVKIDGITYGKGIGHSKKEAEQQAARDAYMKRAK